MAIQQSLSSTFLGDEHSFFALQGNTATYNLNRFGYFGEVLDVGRGRNTMRQLYRLITAALQHRICYNFASPMELSALGSRIKLPA
jgi:hypothetical protein